MKLLLHANYRTKEEAKSHQSSLKKRGFKNVRVIKKRGIPRKGIKNYWGVYYE